MYNILKQQDELKNAPDDQLKLYMSSPTGLYPQYLVMTEMQRRQKMREEFSGGEPPKTSMAEEMSGEAPPEPAAPPPGDPSQGAPPVDPNAQGIMSLPNDTTAGAVMKSRITGQPQMAGDMVASAPQGMAVGGPVAAAMADGGPIRMGAGMKVEGDPDTSPLYDFFNPYRSPEEIAAYNARIQEMKRKQEEEAARIAQSRKVYGAEVAAQNGERGWLTELFTPKGVTASRNEAQAWIPGSSTAFIPPNQRGSSPTPALPTGGPRTDPPAVSPPAPAGANAPQPKLPAPPVKPAPQPAPQSASVSGLPPQPTPAGGSLGDLLKQFEGKGGNEDYMAQMRALLDKQRGDPEELAKQDINMALMQAGFGMMASKNPNFFGAVGEGAMPALTAYGQSKSERKKDERALTASEMEALGINAKMSQEERANAQARAIAIDNARREDEAAAFKRDFEFPETKRSNMATEAAYASRGGDAEGQRVYLTALKEAGDIEAVRVKTPQQIARLKMLNDIINKYQYGGIGGGGGLPGSVDEGLEKELARRNLQ